MGGRKNASKEKSKKIIFFERQKNPHLYFFTPPSQTKITKDKKEKIMSQDPYLLEQLRQASRTLDDQEYKAVIRVRYKPMLNRSKDFITTAKKIVDMAAQTCREVEKLASRPDSTNDARFWMPDVAEDLLTHARNLSKEETVYGKEHDRSIMMVLDLLWCSMTFCSSKDNHEFASSFLLVISEIRTSLMAIPEPIDESVTCVIL